MTTTGLRELRQQASDIIKQAEAGETITVTVSGREVAVLGPVRRNQWRQWRDVEELFRHELSPAADVTSASPRTTGSAPMKVLLDTSILTGTNPGSIDGEIAISVVSLADLHFGVLSAQTEAERAERLRRLAVVERTFDALTVDDVVAREYGRLAAAWASADAATTPATPSALLIAATAVAHDATLITRNADRFAPLSDLVRLQSPSE